MSVEEISRLTSNGVPVKVDPILPYDTIRDGQPVTIHAIMILGVLVVSQKVWDALGRSTGK